MTNRERDDLFDYKSFVANDLIESGDCSGACLVASPGSVGSCDCRCKGYYHGNLADAIVSVDGRGKVLVRERRIAWEKKPFSSTSLVGSFFHGTASPGWQGCVVAEPAPATYLVQLFNWLDGGPSAQRLVSISEMKGWQFYDDADSMRWEYNHGGLHERWERERAEAAGESPGGSMGPLM